MLEIIIGFLVGVGVEALVIALTKLTKKRDRLLSANN